MLWDLHACMLDLPRGARPQSSPGTLIHPHHLEPTPAGTGPSLSSPIPHAWSWDKAGQVLRPQTRGSGRSRYRHDRRPCSRRWASGQAWGCGSQPRSRPWTVLWAAAWATPWRWKRRSCAWTARARRTCGSWSRSSVRGSRQPGRGPLERPAPGPNRSPARRCRPALAQRAGGHAGRGRRPGGRRAGRRLGAGPLRAHAGGAGRGAGPGARPVRGDPRAAPAAAAPRPAAGGAARAQGR